MKGDQFNGVVLALTFLFLLLAMVDTLVAILLR